MDDKEFYTLAEINSIKVGIEFPAKTQERKIWKAIEILQEKLNEVISDINCLHNLSPKDIRTPAKKGSELLQEEIEKVILNSDLWKAFVAGMLTIHPEKKEEAINPAFYQDIAKEIMAIGGR